MAIAHSKVTAQGQISVPAEIRRKLGIGPGSVLEWADAHGEVVIRLTGRYSSAALHRSLFPDGPPPRKRSLGDLKAGLRLAVRRRHARD